MALRTAAALPFRAQRRLQSRRRYFLDKAAPGLNSQEKRKPLLQMWQRQGRGCAYCPGSAETVDHVIPLARGGTNYEGNLAPCCLSCNTDKRDRVTTEWRLAKRAKAGRVRVEPPPVRTPTVKPIKGEEITLKVCVRCNTLHCRAGDHCTNDCRYEGEREAARNRYRVKVGIPLDAPLHTRAA